MLTKSKLLAYRQCPRRLWLELHQPDSKAVTPQSQARFSAGEQVGNIARQHYNPQQTGHLIDLQNDGFAQALAQSQHWLQAGDAPVFEMGFKAAGALAFADVMLPVQASDGSRQWRMVEVKSSTSVKPYHQDDIAIQTYIARHAGVPLQSVALAHINSSWTYPGNGDYEGLLSEVDLTDVAIEKEASVADWIKAAAQIAVEATEPIRATGSHCSDPFECGFLAHCRQGEIDYPQPIHWLPRLGSEKQAQWNQAGIHQLAEVPDDWLNAIQQRVKHCTLANEPYFDAAGAAQDLAPYPLPGYFLDFETIAFAVPVWAGTRPFRQIPFQYSLHTLNASGQTEHAEFLDLSGQNPSRAFAETLIRDCGSSGPVFVYNAGFETARMSELAERFADLAPSLQAINQRVVDLLPIARNRYYHPDQHGSWSIKHLLPTLSSLNYTQLEGVQNGGLAQDAYLRAIDPACDSAEHNTLRRQLLEYCKMDTLAMVEVWGVFTGLLIKTSSTTLRNINSLN